MAAWSDILAQLRVELEESTASVWTDAQFLVWWNEGQRDYSRRALILQDEEYLAWTANVRSYDMPTYTIQPISAYWGDKPLEVTDYLNFSRQTTTSAKPSEVAFYNDAIYVNPLPTVAGTLGFLRYYEPTPLVNATATIPFDSRHSRAVKCFVKARAMEQIGDFDSAVGYDQMYNREVAETEFERIKFEDGAMVRLPTEVW